MAHYIKAMNDAAIDRIYKEQCVELFHRFKMSLDKKDELVLNRGNPSEVTACDLLWQGRTKYDQLGHAFWAWALWTFVIGHPKVKSAAFRVGGPPGSDKATEHNNLLLSQAAGPFKSTFEGGYGIGDGWVTAGPETSFREKTFALEVGEVSPETLFYHLRRGYGFARWPYYSSFVYVFEVPEEVRMQTLDYMMWEHLKECGEFKTKEDLPSAPPRTILDIPKS